MLLAIDTSTSYTGLACCDENGVLGECVWRSGRDHTTQLLPQLSLLLKHIARTSEQITAVGVALGPGSWSGLRVGVSTAKGIALARNLPIVGIGTLDALAYQHTCAEMLVYPLIRLGRERFATALFVGTDQWQRKDAYRNVTLAELCAEVEGPALFCGDVDLEVRTMLQNELHQRAHFPRPAANVRRPSYLAELAWQRLQSNDTDDLVTLEPIYLGHPVKIRDA